MDPIFEQFLTEARENLSFLDQHLNDLKDGDEETINALFRAAHTLKGGAGLVGFNAVKEVTHAAEDLLDAYRKGEIEFKDELVDVLYDAFDEVVELIDAAEEIGSSDVEIDEEVIERLKDEIRSFLQSDESEKQEDSIEVNFAIEDELNITQYFNSAQISKISSNAPIHTPKITKEFVEDENSLWLIDLDLDVDTLKLGNDVVYLFYLLGEENLKSVAICLNDCEHLDSDPLEWRSRVVAIISANSDLIEETFYNVIDDIRLSPLSIENILSCDYEASEDDSTIDEFKKDIVSMFKSADFTQIDEKLSAITQIINPKSKEGYILTTLQALLPNYNISSNEYKDILKIAFLKLGWIDESELNSKQVSKTDEKVDVSKDTKNESKSFDSSSKEVQNALNILNAQLKALELSNDSSLIGRTKLLLSNVLGFLDLDDGVSEANSVEELKELIKNKLNILNSSSSGNTPQKINTQDKPKEVDSVKKASPKESKKTDKNKDAKEAPSAAAHISKTVKIEQYQIDELMDIVGELLVMKNALPYIAKQMTKDSSEHAKRELLTKYEQISRVTDRLQDRVMGMRLLPLSYIFGRYPKLVRDLSKKLDKKIKYVEEGGETKLDKTVIEKLADPMIHIIRNSIDHGLESVDEREQVGKDPTGILKISAKSEGDKVFISISDDGRGIDEQKVVMKAMEMGLVDPEAVDSMSKEEKLKLLFAPGLSTKEEVTELSGRGVGTDAVKKTIEELGGEIHIKSEIGKGTETTFELPLSVALTNIFHVKMNEVNYAIAMDYVVETEKVLKDEIKTANHKPFIKMRGELIPLLFEPILLGYDEPKYDEICLVVIQNQTQKFGLVVDEFVGQLDVVQKPLNGVFLEHPFITGTSLLGNGEVLFVIDPRRIVNI